MEQMLFIVKGCVFDGKVIHDEGKDGVSGLMLPQAWGMAIWIVTERRQMADEGSVCYYSCLLDSIHSFDNLHIDIALIVDYVQQVILVDDLLWYSYYVELHVLWIWESIVEVKVFYIGQDKLCCWSGHYTVE